MLEQEGHTFVDLGLGDHVVVVEHEDEIRSRGGERVHERREHDLGRTRAPCRERLADVRGNLRAGLVDGRQEVRPEAHRIVVACVEAEPGERAVVACGREPLREQGGLARARRRHQQGQPRPVRAYEPLQQAVTRNVPRARPGRLDLRDEHRGSVHRRASLARRFVRVNPGPGRGALIPVALTIGVSRQARPTGVEMSDYELDFDRKVVVITGGGGGIGKAAARALPRRGRVRRPASRRQEVLDLARRQLDPSVTRSSSSPATSARPAARRRWSTAALERFGARRRPRQQHRDLPRRCRSSSRPRSTSRRRSTRSSARRSTPRRRRPARWSSAGGGAIVNVGSMWAIDAITATPTSAYSAAQAGRHSLTKNLAIELAPHGIRVNTVALAFVETPAYERFMTPEEARDGARLGRTGSIRSAATASLRTSSRRSSSTPATRASWITGTTHADRRRRPRRRRSSWNRRRRSGASFP